MPRCDRRQAKKRGSPTMIRCPSCANEAPRETFERAFEVLGGFMNQPVIKCKRCGAVLMESGRFRKNWKPSSRLRARRPHAAGYAAIGGTSRARAG
jgi:ribosomal protein S27E